MDKSRKGGRGLEDLSYLFLSSSQPDKSSNDPTSSRGSSAHTSEAPLVFGIFSSLPMKSFCSCNLLLEIAKGNRRVSVIDFPSLQPSIRHLMGNLVDLQDEFPISNNYHLDFKIESVKLYGFSKITIVSLDITKEETALEKIVEKILAEERIRESHVILINSPEKVRNTSLFGTLFTRLPKAVILMNSQIYSLIETYLLMKKLSPFCYQYFIGNIIHEEEDASSDHQHIERLKRAAQKYLSPNIEIPAVVDIHIDQEALTSVRLRRPLALMESASASGKAIMNLCHHLLPKE
ncbi:MAG: hypothetical protein ACMUIA_01755 [bacterium]